MLEHTIRRNLKETKKGSKKMPLRILTGVIMVSKREGSATISFNPHTVTGEASGAELRASGADGNFAELPGKVVSLRQIRVSDKNTYWGGSQTDMFTINDDAITRHNLVVRWSSSGGSQIEEISYMIVGEVEQ